MTLEERSILNALDRSLDSANSRSIIDPVVERVHAQLARNEEAVMAWEPMPLHIFGNALPTNIRSSWVFILRAGANTGAERHPNSHQRMMSFAGTGNMQVRSNLDFPWHTNVLVSDSAAPLEQRWISIPPNVWHQPVVGAETDWVVVSFHTVPAEELIEERRDPTAGSRTKQMKYLR
jgi:hypothetical protein